MEEGWKLIATCRVWKEIYLSKLQKNENVKLGHCYSMDNMKSCVTGDYVVIGIAYSGRIVLLTKSTALSSGSKVLFKGSHLVNPKYKYHVSLTFEDNSHFISISLSDANCHNV